LVLENNFKRFCESDIIYIIEVENLQESRVLLRKLKL